jgi:uncharacterized iron-regulated membrane protein
LQLNQVCRFYIGKPDFFLIKPFFIMIKKCIRPIHLIVGFLSGIVLFIVAVTGCITAFDEELKSIVYSDLMEVKVSSSKVKTIQEILSIAQQVQKDVEIKNVNVKLDKTRSTEVLFHNDQTIYINPYSGKVLGELNKHEDFFGVVLEIHKNLYLGETGAWITSVSALLFFFMLLSGIILWWPRKRAIMEKFSIKRKVHWRKTNYDLHSVLGFYASWIIIFTVITGLIWAFSWAEDGLYWVTNSKKPPRIEIESIVAHEKTQHSIDLIYAKAIGKFPKHKECIINIPEGESGSFRVVFRHNDKGFYRQIDNLYFDQYTGKVIKEKLFDKLSLGDKLKITNINIHTGKVFGLFGQLLVFFASLICASLPITGFLIWKGKRNKGR